jgi:hypothetical protein
MDPTAEQVEHIVRWARDTFPGRAVTSSLNDDRDVALFRVSRPGQAPLELEVSYKAFEDVPLQGIVDDLTLHGTAEALLRTPEARLLYTRERKLQASDRA